MNYSDGTFVDVLQFLIMGIQRGSIYAMVAMGFNMIYNSTGIINFAQGEFVVLGGLMMVSLTITLIIICQRNPSSLSFRMLRLP